MATIEQQDPEGNYTIRFYFGKRRYNRSLNTTKEKTAIVLKGRVEETIRYLRRGVWKLPPDATYDDAGEFIISGGERTQKPGVIASMSLAQMIDAYRESLPDQAKANTTISGEETHFKHLKRLLKPSTPFQSIGIDLLQTRYVNKRAKEKGLNGHKVQPRTIQKEIQTFHQLWEFASVRGWVSGDLKRSQLAYPKANAKPPFKTWDEIKRELERGGLTESEENELWDCLFLREQEVMNLIKFVVKKAEHDFVVPLFAIPAFTGARRSEVIRSKIDDFPLDGGSCFLREKKRKKDKNMSYRQVPLFEPLRKTLSDWYAKHSGGKYTICTPGDLARSRSKSEGPQPLTRDMAHGFFQRTLKGSKWEVVKGFHTLRHSFASICAMKGISQQVIDAWMGHQTEEMRERYRHLFPEQSKEAAKDIFNASGLFRRRR